MMKNPKISVIMSTFNGMPYLKEAIESILVQTYKNFEFIIVDDASKDGSWKYLKSLKDNRIKLIKNKKNLGLASSLNIALRRAQGDFVARMDADDISLPTRFAEQIKFLKDHFSVDICGAWVDLIDHKGKTIGEKTYPVKDQQIKKALNLYNPIVHPTYMSKKKFYKKLKGYNPEFDYAEDYEILIRAKRYFGMANIPQKLLLFRFQDQRRSRKEMDKMDKVDLKIKYKNISENGLSILGLIGFIKKILMIYLIPQQLKIKIATILKLA